MWGVLSEDRMGLSFTIAASPRQRSHSRVRFPWDSRPYSTVSDSRISFSSPPTTRRVTVEVFNPASTRELKSQSYVTTDGQSAGLSSTHLGPKTRFLLLSDSCGFVDVGRLL
jgi:hypothetical protein